MSRELPGFYFDAEKNRYFPSSSRKDEKSCPPEPRSPATHPPTSDAASSSSSTPVPQTRRRSSGAWHALQRQMMTAQLEASTAYQAIPIPVFTGQTVTAFSAGNYDGHVWSVAGDSYGILHTFDPSPCGNLLSIPSHVLQHSWTRGYRLESPVTRTFLPLAVPPENSWEVPGVRQRALLIQDIESLSDTRCLETQSDVFALHQEECLVYTGSRNGFIRRFDTRTRAPGQTLLGEAFAKHSNSITYLNIIKDCQLLVSTIRGAIEIFDIRFPHEARPLLALVGNVNSYQPNLPHAVTPSQDYFFAAGLDNFIRGWSLVTGEPLSQLHTSASPALTLEVPGHRLDAVDMGASPFGVKFEERITSLAITQEQGYIDLSLDDAFQMKHNTRL
ncbi:hypothetical protein BJV74DRAFT_881139 [Russula compacta]|nr:hypothetical protein BJV74DRAFT_881139 [Russula compacta]